jgi:acyl-CoA hydrolase
MTALTLEKPKSSNELERRFLEPLVERVFGNYPDLDYIAALRKGQLPANVKLVEFYFKPGAFLNSPVQQQHYISCNYTDVASVFCNAGVNVIAQMVSQKIIDNQAYYSFSSNTDVTLDLLPLLREQQRQGKEILVIGQTNTHMPFMYRDAMVEPAVFDMLIDNPAYDFTLFGAPNMAVDAADYLIGLYVSTLISDGGTLQIGIGALGDAIVYACQLRHRENELYKNVLADLNILQHFSNPIEQVGGTEIFKEGLS